MEAECRARLDQALASLPLDHSEPTKGEMQTAGQDLFTTMRNKWVTGDAERMGKMAIEEQVAEGYRVTFKDDHGVPCYSSEFWMDPKSRRLILLRAPGLERYDPDKDPVRHNPPEAESDVTRSRGVVMRDIVYDQELEDSLFSLEPLKGYSVETRHQTEGTEHDRR